MITHKLLRKVIEGTRTPNYYLKRANTFWKTGDKQEAGKILENGLKKYPKNLRIREQYAVYAMKVKTWDDAAFHWEFLLNSKKEKPYFILRLTKALQSENRLDFNNLIMLSMLNQIMGNQVLSANIFDDVLKTFPNEIKQDGLGYRKLTLFDNGKSRIEFYKNLKPTKSLVITFDAAKIRWNEKPFGFKLLQRQNVDIIAVRKKTKKDYHQDLSKDAFDQTIKELAGGYDNKFSYGYSLGAYSALYYTSEMNCQILALSPRLPIHPIYGTKEDKGKQTLHHTLSHKFNDKAFPIIIYDPKNKTDRKYVEESLLTSYPKAQLKKLPYGGHRMTFHLLSMGVLKEYVLTFINEGSVPAYDRNLKSQSPNYCRLLGEACLKHNKIGWAYDLSLKALELEPTNKRAIKFRVDVLEKLNRKEEAIKIVEKSVEMDPKNLDNRLMLIDLYLDNKDITVAKKELDKACKQFKRTPKLIKRETRIYNAWENSIS